ncbi:hypothetical protein AciX9_2668 [Granulicella tundricola MP5ACTX9]|uniref:Uncharacterized protein n=1 Tax=Granulicella tundricola (strain ATCC BAA-1859 / DSM 23138 / MP5ACTX9) TaxID=1198114 RepID=E8WX50_GRATM|nr:hypothetical protein AciX9_2668 [Granulicella tundricola MP5ACTX9]
MQLLVDEPWKDELWYQNQWRAFYRERMRKLSRLGVIFGTIGIGALLFGVIPSTSLEHHPFLSDSAALLGGLLWLTLLIQWFRMNWQMTSWDCPRCNELYFKRNPFRHRCAHCKLRRPRQREVSPLNSF